MQKVLVTGAGGFIGSHLTEMLLEKGYSVRALVHYNSFNFRGWLEKIPENRNLEIITGDVRDPHFCKEIVRGMDIIYHLASLIAIPFSYVAPDSYVETNIKGTLNICQAAKEAGGIRIVHTSTSEVYGTAQYVPIDERHPKQPQSPYSASKIGADMVALSFFHAFNLPVSIARPFNTYGPRQSARAIIPTVISQIITGIKEIKLGDLKPKRDFNYVIDTCRGFIAIGECNEAIGKEINIASNTEIGMDETLGIIKEILDCDVTLKIEQERIRPVNSEVFRLMGDNTLIKKLTGFQPEFSIRNGLEQTCAWFKTPGNLNHYKPSIYNL